MRVIEREGLPDVALARPSTELGGSDGSKSLRGSSGGSHESLDKDPVVLQNHVMVVKAADIILVALLSHVSIYNSFGMELKS